MPKILIWPAKGEYAVGHAAVTTDKYYISIWPNRPLDLDGKKIKKITDGLEIMSGVTGSLVLNQKVDRENEGDSDPIEYGISATVSNEDINSIYEEFLRYNEINPEDVTLARGEGLFQEYQEYEKLTAEEVQGKEEPKLPQQLLRKTKYSFSVEVVNSKEEDESVQFYHKQQSCVSFTINLIQTAWLKQHPDRPIDIIPKEINDPHAVIGYPYKVSWLEEVVKKHFTSSDVTYTTKKSKDIPFMPTKNEIYTFSKRFFILVFVLGVISYYYVPVLRYPVFFTACVYISVNDFRMIHFVLVLFLTLLSYSFPVPIIAITVVYVFYKYCKAFIELKRSSEALMAIFEAVVPLIEQLADYQNGVPLRFERMKNTLKEIRLKYIQPLYDRFVRNLLN